MTAKYHYENKAYRKHPGKCPKLDYEESGSGTIPVVNAMGGDAGGAAGSVAFFHLGAVTGDAARLGWRGLVGNFLLSPQDFSTMQKEPSKDVYFFSLGPVIMEFKGKRQQTCGDYKDYEGRADAVLHVTHGFSEGGMYGSYSWGAKPSPGEKKGSGLGILDWCGVRKLGPEEKGSGNHSLQVSWQIGEMKPIVRIKRLKNMGGQEIWDDITDRQGAKPEQLLPETKAKLERLELFDSLDALPRNLGVLFKRPS